VSELGPLSEQVLEALDDAAVVTDGEGTILWASPRVAALWGYAPAEIQRKKLQFLIAYETSDLLQAAAGERRENGRLRAVEAYRRDGSTFPVGITQVSAATGGERRILVLLRDLSEIRQARDRLRQFEKALETAQVGVAIADRNLALRYANPALAEMHDAPRASLAGESLARFLPRELAGLDFRELANLRRLRREGIAERRDGSTFPVEAQFDLVHDDQGDAVGVVALCQDITERRRTEQALRESEERYALAVRGANDGLWDWDLADGTVYFSGRWQAMLGPKKTCRACAAISTSISPRRASCSRTSTACCIRTATTAGCSPAAWRCSTRTASPIASPARRPTSPTARSTTR